MLHDNGIPAELCTTSRWVPKEFGVIKGDSGSRWEPVAYCRRLNWEQQDWERAKKIHKPKPELEPWILGLIFWLRLLGKWLIFFVTFLQIIKICLS